MANTGLPGSVIMTTARKWAGPCAIVMASGAVACSSEVNDVLLEASLIPHTEISVEPEHQALVALLAEPWDGAVLDTLSAERRMGDWNPWYLVTALRVVGDHLFVSDQQGRPRVTVFDWASGDQLAAFGEPGQGPGELINASWITYPRSEDDGVWVFDSGNRKFVEMRWNGTGAFEVGREFRLLSPLPPSHPVWNKDGILSNGYFPASTLIQMDSLGNPTRRISIDPPARREGIEDVRGGMSFNRTRVAVGPSGGRLVLAYQSDSRIDIVDADGSLVVEYRSWGPAGR